MKKGLTITMERGRKAVQILSPEKLEISHYNDMASYLIKNQETHITGEVTVIYRELSELAGKYQKFYDLGLKDDDRVADLLEFFPNGRYINENDKKHVKKGTGTKVLKRAIRDALLSDVKAVYCGTDKISMKSFLGKKHKFESLDNGDRGYVKSLKRFNRTRKLFARFVNYFDSVTEA
jgi:hypothetical protein